MDNEPDIQDGSRRTNPPDDVQRCAAYINEQRNMIAEKKRDNTSRIKLIAECVNALDVEAMNKQLQPKRYGWVIEKLGATSK